MDVDLPLLKLRPADQHRPQQNHAQRSSELMSQENMMESRKHETGEQYNMEKWTSEP